MQLSALTHYLLPQESNNQKARVLHSSFLLVILFFFFVYQIGLSVLSTHPVAILGYAAQISPQEVIRLTNIKRAESGLPALTYNESLSKAAAAKASDMINRDYWAHVAPDGTQPWKFFGDVGYKYRYAGENLARDFRDPSSAVDAWMASPSHKENLLSAKYKDIGVAVIDGDLSGSDTTIVVQLFGTRLGDTATTITTVAAADKAPSAAQTAPIATVVPTAAPQTQPVTEVSAAVPSQVNSDSISVSSFDATKYVSLALLLFLGGVMVIDALIITRRQVPRLSGRVFAHLSFFGMIFTIVLIAKAGNIL